jgi:hypothetical protein
MSKLTLTRLKKPGVGLESSPVSAAGASVPGRDSPRTPATVQAQQKTLQTEQMAFKQLGIPKLPGSDSKDDEEPTLRDVMKTLTGLAVNVAEIKHNQTVESGRIENLIKQELTVVKESVVSVESKVSDVEARVAALEDKEQTTSKEFIRMRKKLNRYAQKDCSKLAVIGGWASAVDGTARLKVMDQLIIEFASKDCVVDKRFHIKKDKSLASVTHIEFKSKPISLEDLVWPNHRQRTRTVRGVVQQIQPRICH